MISPLEMFANRFFTGTVRWFSETKKCRQQVGAGGSTSRQLEGFSSLSDTKQKSSLTTFYRKGVCCIWIICVRGGST